MKEYIPTPLEMLDDALKWFAMDVSEMSLGALIPRTAVKRDEAMRDMCRLYKSLNTPEFMLWADMILDRLVRDGNLAYTERTENYGVTFDGKLFSKTGGYAKQEKINAASERKKDRRELMLIVGTWAAGIGAFALVIWEMYKTFCLHL